MNKEQNLNEPQNQQLNIAGVSSSYICAECGTEHKGHELKMADNDWDYSYYCKNCGDVIESNGTYYGK
jgi:DNA-directed RNA polymerase subunit RPC12/RpoP